MAFVDKKYTTTTGINQIGVPGEAGFGVGICPAQLLPDGMVPLFGYDNTDADNYGNYQYKDGSIMCWIPKFYYLISTLAVDIKGIDTYPNQNAANADSYALHRAFIDGGVEQPGFFIDKYKCSKTAWGTGYIASSIKNGLPISTAADHNPIADLTACDTNAYFECIDAAHARDGVDGAVNGSSIFHCSSKFQTAALAMLSLAHGQASSGTAHCAWYDATYNYPKGCNDNALGDTDDATVLYVTDGYSNCGKTGSGTPFAKTTHNGQECGVADLNGLMYEVNIGMTRTGSDFYVAKETTTMKDFTSGNSAATDHWGATGVAAMMDILTLSYVTGNDGWIYYGNGANQVLAEDVSGNSWILTGLGFPESIDGLSAVGTNLFGKDGFYRYIRNELCVLSCHYWGGTSTAGVWASTLHGYREGSDYYVGFRCESHYLYERKSTWL